MIVAAAAGARRRARSRDRRFRQRRGRGGESKEARARSRRRALVLHARNLRSSSARDRGLVVRPAWHCVWLKFGRGRRVIEAINTYRAIHKFTATYDPDAAVLDRGSLLPPDGKNFAFVPWRRDGVVPVLAMPSPFGILRVKTPTVFPKSLGGGLPEDAFDSLLVSLKQWRTFTPMAIAPRIDAAAGMRLWGSFCGMGGRRRRRRRKPAGPGHPKIQALLDELVNSALDTGDSSSLGFEFAQRGIVVQHIEWKGLHGLCFQILPFRDNGRENPNWTGPLPLQIDAVRVEEVEGGGGFSAGAGSTTTRLADALPVAEAIAITGSSTGSSIYHAAHRSGHRPSVYAVPEPRNPVGGRLRLG